VGITADGNSAVVKTLGNPDRHIVLRGGGGKPNYSPEDIDRAHGLVASQGIARPIMVDCSHDNSNKDHTRQAAACRAVLEQYGRGRTCLMGLMIESNLRDGKQAWKRDAELAYGVSITDACIGWEETESLLTEAASVVAATTPPAGADGGRQVAAG
jgi:3-deoxy-7-phosphoheptulonate synthase